MILYNVTYNVETEIEQEWLRWMKQEHIPHVLATQFFSEYKIFRLISQEPQGTTYAVQFLTQTMDKANEYLSGAAREMQHQVITKYGTKVMSFQTLLEQV